MEAHTFAQDVAFTIMAVTWMGGMLLAAYLSPLLISGGQKIMGEHDPYAEVQSLRTALADARGVIASRNLTIIDIQAELSAAREMRQNLVRQNADLQSKLDDLHFDLEQERLDSDAGVDENGVSNA